MEFTAEEDATAVAAEGDRGRGEVERARRRRAVAAEGAARRSIVGWRGGEKGLGVSKEEWGLCGCLRLLISSKSNSNAPYQPSL